MTAVRATPTETLETVPVLQRIVARTREDVRARERRTPLSVLRELDVPPRRDFVAALRRPGLSLIAEFKPASPSRGVIRAEADAATYAAAYGRHADAISVLCDVPFFGGGYSVLAQFRAACTRPLLCKDFIVGEYQIWEARAYGADAVLLMASVLEQGQLRDLLDLVHGLGMQALVEAHSDAQLDTVLATDARIIGLNSRDLETLEVDPARPHRMRERIARERLTGAAGDRLVVAESGVRSRAQVDTLRGAFDAVLIGTAFMLAADPAACLREFGW